MHSLHTRGCLAGVRAVVAVVALYSVVFAQEQRKCWIESMVGDVKLRRGTSVKWIDARVKMPLHENDAIRTFVESEAVIAMGDGSRISVRENTTLELSALRMASDGGQNTNVKILSGDVVSNIKKLVSKKSSFDFETPTAVASIRGTRVGFSVTGERTDILVYEGRVYVVPKGSRNGAEIGANQMTSVAKGQQSVQVVALDTTSAQTTGGAAGSADTASTDSGGPTIQLNSPEDGQVVLPGAQLVVAGVVSPAASKVSVGGKAAQVSPRGTFRVSVAAPQLEGEHEIVVEAAYAGQSRSESRKIVVGAAPGGLVLTLATPREGDVVTKPLIVVSGTVTPGATVSVHNAGVAVGASGAFSKEVHIPEEAGAVVIEVEASLGDEKKVETRTVEFSPPRGEIWLDVQQPLDKSQVCDTRVPVSGSVRPVGAEVTVNDKKLAVRNGRFMDFTLLPNEPGQHEIEFEVSTEYGSESFKRIVDYDPAGSPKCNIDPPRVVPTYLPPSTAQTRLPFTVMDRTPMDEVTFFTERDGSEDSETGRPGAQFVLELEEGLHEYKVYAKDIAGNRSQSVAGKVMCIPRMLTIFVRKPRAYEVVHVPPGTPDGAHGEPEYTVEFEIENLPDDNPQLLKEVKVQNQATGQTIARSTFTDVDFDIDVRLKRGKNPIAITVTDANERKVTQQVTIELR